MGDINHDIITCNVSNTVTSSLSSVTSVARDFIEQMFPEGYFRDVYITTTQASSEMSSMDVDEIKVRQYPFMAITPGYIPDGNEAIMNPFPLWRRGQFERFREDGRYGYKNIFYNDTDEIYISAIPYRIKFSFEYKFKLESHMNKIDFTHILRQKFQQSERFFINGKFFEAELPNTIVKAISKIKDYDLSEKEEYDEFCDYMNTYSKGNIHHALIHSTGRKRFTHTYQSNILVNVESAPTTEGRSRAKINMADDEGEVEMELSMELWIPGNYMFKCKHLPKDDYNDDLLPNERKVIVDKAIAPMFNKTKGTRTLTKVEKIVTDVNKTVDRVSIEDLVENDVAKLIRENSARKDLVILKILLDFEIYRDHKKMEEGVDYTIDWKSREIVMINPFQNYIYTVGIYIDQSVLYRLIGPKAIQH